MNPGKAVQVCVKSMARVMLCGGVAIARNIYSSRAYMLVIAEYK